MNQAEVSHGSNKKAPLGKAFDVAGTQRLRECRSINADTDSFGLCGFVKVMMIKDYWKAEWYVRSVPIFFIEFLLWSLRRFFMRLTILKHNVNKIQEFHCNLQEKSKA